MEYWSILISFVALGVSLWTLRRDGESRHLAHIARKSAVQSALWAQGSHLLEASQRCRSIMDEVPPDIAARLEVCAKRIDKSIAGIHLLTDKLKGVDSDRTPSYRTRVWWEGFYGDCQLMLEQAKDLAETVGKVIDQVDEDQKKQPKQAASRGKAAGSNSKR